MSSRPKGSKWLTMSILLISLKIPIEISSVLLPNQILAGYNGCVGWVFIHLCHH